MRILIGFGLILVGGVLGALTGFIPFLIILFVGVFMFASIFTEATYCDYVIANTNKALMRKRYYANFIPFTIISLIVTLFKAPLMIVWKEEYFIATLDSEQNELKKISRKEYIVLRDEQRKIYSTQTFSKEFMESSYTLDAIGFQRKKRRLNIAGFFAVLFLTMLIIPGGIAIALPYEAIFIPMVLLWIPEYKDAKILQNAFEKAMSNTTI